VKWREYETEAARKQDQGATGPRNGTMREGHRWGSGPQLRTAWAISEGPPRVLAIVHEAPHGRSWSLAQDNQPLSERARDVQ
jgi:hypothetical protein